MGTLEDLGRTIIDGLSEDLRDIIAFIFIVFTIGIAIGWQITLNAPTLIGVALILSGLAAFFAYINTEFAVIVFLIFAIIAVIL